MSDLEHGASTNMESDTVPTSAGGPQSQQTESDLRITMEHFRAALRTVRPSVSDIDLIDFRRF